MLRARRLLVISLVVLTVLLVAGYSSYRILVDRQKDAYAAGHIAYLQGDCLQALPKLERARSAWFGWLDGAVSANADKDVKPCRRLQAVQAKAARQKPAEAVITYLAYLKSRPEVPLATVAQGDARSVLISAPLANIVTESLCDQQPVLKEYDVLTIATKDPLAPPFLAACGAIREKDDPVGAYRMYKQIQTDFRQSAQAGTTLLALGRVVNKIATPFALNEWPDAAPFRADDSLNGRTRLVIQNNDKAALSMLLTGPSTRLLRASGCENCAGTKCPGRGPSVTVVLTPGRYSVVSLDDAEKLKLKKGTWNLKGDQEYSYCFYS